MMSFFEQEFSIPLIRTTYFGFDFEALLIPNNDTIIQELTNDLHLLYKKELSLLKRRYCKCPDKQAKHHEKGCEYNWKMKKIYDEYCQIPILGFNSEG